MSESNRKILVIDDDDEIRYSLQRVLSSQGFSIVEAGSGEEGIPVAEAEQPHVILLDNRMKGMSGMEALQHLRSVVPNAMVILMTAYGNTQTAIEAMKFGAFDYVIKPFDLKKISSLVESALAAHQDLSKEKQDYQPLLNSEDYQEGIVGTSDRMQEVFKMIGQVASSDATVMITGESGTGKELIARALYKHSHRQGRPFIAVNCAAIPENLIESELFGHEKGSFTGATAQRIGKFELCDGGTIFLDEIGDMSLSTQTKILRALQEGEIQRVGGMDTIKVDVRMIAATNKDLEKQVQKKRFREDLYYRLNVVRLRLPALRERKDDIPQLVDFILQRLGKERKISARQLSMDAMDVLTSYEWPGNVRELENVVYRSAVIAQGDTVLVKDLPEEVRMVAARPVVVSDPAGEPAPDTPPPSSPQAGVLATEIEPSSETDPADPMIFGVSSPDSPIPAGTLEDSLDNAYQKMRNESDQPLLPRFEKAMIERVLKETSGNQVKASALLGITRGTLRKRIEQYDLK